MSSDLGFSDSDRIENNRRAMELGKLLANNNIIPIVTLISPFDSERLGVKESFKNFNFNLIYLNVDIDVCRDRDLIGLYKKNSKNFTGIGSRRYFINEFTVRLHRREVTSSTKNSANAFAQLKINL